MSTTLGGFVIHHDANENQGNAELLKGKRGEMQGKGLAPKRTALGSLTNTSRVQPFRAAKQASLPEQTSLGLRDENAQAKVAKTTFTVPQAQNNVPFTIFVDEDSTSQPAVADVDMGKSLEKVQLHHNLTALRPALSVIEDHVALDDSSESDSIDSPMLLDTSLDVRHSERESYSKLLSVSEYSQDIYSYLRELELRNRPKPAYMERQPDITNSMRSILVDWLVEVAEEYQLHRETIFLASNYIDRFLSEMSVLRGKLQLVGAASMFLASKYEEIYPPEVKEFVYITDDTYTNKQILRMEHLVLKVLSFNVAVPTANIFCEKFLDLLGYSEKDAVFSLAMYLCETTLIDGDTYLKYLPSQIAASAVCLACGTLNLQAWSEKMVLSTGYSISDFQLCLKDLYFSFCRAPSHPQQAIREKYKKSKYHKVSVLTPPPVLPIPHL